MSQYFNQDNYNNNSKFVKDDINQLKYFQQLIREDDSPIKEIIRTTSSDENNDFSINVNDLKNVLEEISSLFQLNLETVLESFLVKFADSQIISFEDFKNYFLENLEKQEKILSTINLNYSMDNNNENNLYNRNPQIYDNLEDNKNDFDYQENKINSINLNNLNETDNLFLMILHRSLYILKKKFEIYSPEIKIIYDELSEKNKFNKIVNLDNFISVLDKIFKLVKVNFLDINYPSDLFKAEIIEEYSEEKLSMMEKQIKNFMLKNRKFYNDKFKYKRDKELYQIFQSQKDAIVKKTSNIISESNNKPNITQDNQASTKNNNKKGGMKLNESNNNVNASLNESKVSKANDFKRKESIVNNFVKNTKNAGNTSTKNLNTSQRKELESAKSKQNNLTTPKNNIKKPSEKEETSKILSNEINEENNPEEDNNIINENAVNKLASFNLNELNINNNILSDPNNILELNNNFNENIKDNQNNLFSIDNIEDFRKKTLDDEIKSIIMDDGQEMINLKINHNKSNNKNDNSIKYLVIESIPLIIADFIHENINIALLDMSNDLKSDLRGLFDKDIIKKIEEANQYDNENENVLKLKEYLFEKLNTQKNIKTYEDLFLNKKTHGENTSHIINILEKLRNHLSLLEKKIKEIQNSNNNDNYRDEKGATIIENVLNIDQNPLNFNDNSVVNYNKSPNTETMKAVKNFVSKIIPKKKKTKDEIRKENFREIFDFYAKQHQFTGKNATFEEIQEKFNLMVLSEYNKFANEFKIPLKKEVISELYKKHAKNAKDMHFDEFMSSLEKMSIRMNEEKIKSLLAKIKKLRGMNSGTMNDDNKKTNINQKTILIKNSEDVNDVNQVEEYNENDNIENSSNLRIENNNSINLNVTNDRPNEIADNNFENEYRENKNSTQEEILKTQKLVFELKKKNSIELLNELYNLIEIDDTKAYHSKMKGFIVPFFSDKVSLRLPENSPKRILKYDPQVAENVRKILKERKEQKLKESEEKEKLEKLNLIENKKKSKLINEKLKSNLMNVMEKNSTKDKVTNKYADIKKKQENITKEKETKLTWDQLENLNYNHFISNREDDFNPNDLFDNNTDSDDENLFDDSNNPKTTILNTLKSKKTQSTGNYLNIQTNLNIPNSNQLKNYHSNIMNLNSSELNTIPDPILNNRSGKIMVANNTNQESSRNYGGNLIKGYNKNQKNVNVLRNQNHSPNLYGQIAQSISNSSGDGNISNLSFLENESRKPSHKHSTDQNNSYENGRGNSGNRDGKKNEDNYYNGNNFNKNRKVSDNNLIRAESRSLKHINRSIEKSANSINRKNKRESNDSNIYINPNQRYESPKGNKSKKQIYSIEKTEKMAREMEKNMEDKKSKLVNKHDDLVKKSIDKIKKYL